MVKLSRRSFLSGSMIAAAGGASLRLGACASDGGAAKVPQSGQIAGFGSSTGKGGELNVECVLEDGKLLHGERDMVARFRPVLHGSFRS